MWAVIINLRAVYIPARTLFLHLPHWQSAGRYKTCPYRLNHSPLRPNETKHAGRRIYKANDRFFRHAQRIYLPVGAGFTPARKKARRHHEIHPTNCINNMREGINNLWVGINNMWVGINNLRASVNYIRAGIKPAPTGRILYTKTRGIITGQ